MRIDTIKLYTIRLPFVGSFSHAQKKGAFAHNIIVEIIATQVGLKGYGEGAPRTYVTGETQESAANSVKYLIREHEFPWDLNDVSQIWDFIDNLQNGNNYNSAICALEMALIDALAREQNRNFLEYFPQNHLVDKVYYGAGTLIVPKKRALELIRFFQNMGISKLKLKMGKDIKNNRDTMDMIRNLFGYDYDLKIDVNGAWDYGLALKHVPLIKEYKIKVVEQPMIPDDRNISKFADKIICKENDVRFWLKADSICQRRICVISRSHAVSTGRE